MKKNILLSDSHSLFCLEKKNEISIFNYRKEFNFIQFILVDPDYNF